MKLTIVALFFFFFFVADAKRVSFNGESVEISLPDEEFKVTGRPIGGPGKFIFPEENKLLLHRLQTAEKDLETLKQNLETFKQKVLLQVSLAQLELIKLSNLVVHKE